MKQSYSSGNSDGKNTALGSDGRVGRSWTYAHGTLGALAHRVRDSLLFQIRSGQLRPGDRIPTIRALARQFRVSDSTAHDAVESLRGEGYLRCQRAKGSFVTAPAQNRRGLTSITVACHDRHSWLARSAFSQVLAGFWGRRRLEVSLRSGNVREILLEPSIPRKDWPDLLIVAPGELPELIQARLVHPLEDDQFPNWPNDGIWRAASEIYTFRKTRYAIPLACSSVAVATNESLLADVGGEYPLAGLEWTEFTTLMRRLTRPTADGAILHYGFVLNCSPNRVLPFVWQCLDYVPEMGRAIPIAAWEEGLEFYYALHHRYRVAPSIPTWSDAERAEAFLAGRIATMLTSAFHYRPLAVRRPPFRLGLRAGPYHRQRAGALPTLAVVLPRKSERPNEAVLAAAMGLLEAEPQRALGKDGGVVPIRPDARDALPDAERIFADELVYAHSTFNPAAPEAERTMGQVFEMLALNLMTPRTAAEALVAQLATGVSSHPGYEAPLPKEAKI